MDRCILRSERPERVGGEGYRGRRGTKEYFIGQSHEEEGGWMYSGGGILRRGVGRRNTSKKD